MRRIYTYGGKPASRNLTIVELPAAKGKRKFTQVTASTADEAAATSEADIDIITTGSPLTAEIRKGAPETFLPAAFMLTDYRSEEAVIDAAFEAMEDGTDAVYTLRSLRMSSMLAEMNMPVMGHLGLVPRHSTGTGGLRAAGKTAEEAPELNRDLKRLEDAGPFAVEVEIVPEEVLAEITNCTSLVTFSIGAGSAGDVQFLFMEDVCGDSETPPRHAKAYADLRAMRRKFSAKRYSALKAFHRDVESGGYPGRRHIVGMDPVEFAKFREGYGEAFMSLAAAGDISSPLAGITAASRE